MLVTQSCLTLCNPMDFSPLGSSVHKILRGRILEWDASSFPRGSSWLWAWTYISHMQADSFFFFNWRIITLQHCGSFCHTSTWVSCRYTCVPPFWTPSHLPPYLIPLGCPRALALLHASNLHRSSILHMVIYMFQCCSLKSSHPHLPHSPKVCVSFAAFCIGSSLLSF